MKKIPQLLASALFLAVPAAACAQGGQHANSASLLSASTLHLQSRRLSEQRQVRVVVPESYGNGSARYPVVYVLDGNSNLEHTAVTARHLARFGRMPEAIIVAVHNRNRELDMTPPEIPFPMLGGATGRADDFLAFFREELIPFIDERYQTSEYRVLIGHSHGGLFTAYALATDPSVFGGYIAIDAPMHVGNRALAQSLPSVVTGERVRLVNVERQLGWIDEDWAELAAQANTSFHADRFEITPDDESHSSMALQGTYDGLKTVFSGFPGATLAPRTLAELETEFAEMGVQYGYDPNPSRWHLLESASDLLVLQQARNARDVVERGMELYGSSASFERLMARAIEVENETGGVVGPANPLPDHEGAGVDAARPLVGKWDGRMHHEGGVPEHFVINISIEGESVIGTIASYPMRGGDLREARPLDFVRILADGTLEFAHQNGRRPGGSMFYAVEPDGPDAFIGVKELKAVILPVGILLPTMHIELKRQTEGQGDAR